MASVLHRRIAEKQGEDLDLHQKCTEARLRAQKPAARGLDVWILALSLMTLSS